MDLMIFILNSLINVCLVVAIWKLSRRKPKETKETIVVNRVSPMKELFGKMDKMYIRSVLAEKLADRAFNMASSANLGVIALQKSLQVPRILNKQQGLKNQLAKNDVDKLFSSSGTFDYLRPILSDEENDLLDDLEQQKFKADMSNNGTI